MTVFELTFTFFQTYLLKEKGLSDNTVASYAESVKQLLNFAAKKDNIQLHKLDLASFRAGLVRSFLDQIDKKNSIATRNLRLSAIRTFFKYLGKQHPSMLAAAEDICALANKKTSETIIDHLKENEVHAFIDLARQQPNELKRARDTAVFLLMHNTGARASEIVHLTIEDFEMSPLPIITLTGKGRKNVKSHYGARPLRLSTTTSIGEKNLLSKHARCSLILRNNDSRDLDYATSSANTKIALVQIIQLYVTSP